MTIYQAWQQAIFVFYDPPHLLKNVQKQSEESRYKSW